MEIEKMLTMLEHAQKHREVMMKLLKQAEAVIPVLLDDKRERSAERLQSAIDEFKEQDDAMTEYGSKSGAAAMMKGLLRPDVPKDDYKATQAVEEELLNKYREN